MTLGKFNNAHRKTFKVKFDYQNRETREFVFADSAAKRRSWVYACVSTYVCLNVFVFVALGFQASNPSQRECSLVTARGQSMVTSGLPVGSEVARPQGNEWRHSGPTGLTQQSERYIEPDSQNLTPTMSKEGEKKLISFIPTDLLIA